jgi:hypothetical protein
MLCRKRMVGQASHMGGGGVVTVRRTEAQRRCHELIQQDSHAGAGSDAGVE